MAIQDVCYRYYGRFAELFRKSCEDDDKKFSVLVGLGEGLMLTFGSHYPMGDAEKILELIKEMGPLFLRKEYFVRTNPEFMFFVTVFVKLIVWEISEQHMLRRLLTDLNTLLHKSKGES